MAVLCYCPLRIHYPVSSHLDSLALASLTPSLRSTDENIHSAEVHYHLLVLRPRCRWDGFEDPFRGQTHDDSQRKECAEVELLPQRTPVKTLLREHEEDGVSGQRAYVVEYCAVVLGGIDPGPEDGEGRTEEVLELLLHGGEMVAPNALRSHGPARLHVGVDSLHGLLMSDPGVQSTF